MDKPYSEDFFKGQQAGSIASAKVVVPLTLSLVPIGSVADIGCGVGGWLKEFERCGVTDYLGFDGDYVLRDLLRIPGDRFVSCELTTLTDVGRRFDLVCSLEVAEHLPEEAAEPFVDLLTNTAPVVLFSAAIPGQGGVDHLNEQYQSYWASLFAQRGYVAVDCVRPTIFYDERVEWWYRQNLLMFCEPDRCPAQFTPATSRYHLDRVHPEFVQRFEAGPQSGKAALRAAKRDLKVLGKAVLRRTGLSARLTHESRDRTFLQRY